MYGQQAKKELCYDNIKISTNAWDSNLIKANGKYISVNWNASGGGAFAVIPVTEVGKSPDQVSLFRGHTATVLDTDFNPFNDNIIISGSDDTKVGLWKIPDDYSFRNYTDDEGNIKDVAPVALYSGHKRKVGHVQFHPTAENVAASSSLDYTVKLWDVETGTDKITLEHKDLVTSFSFNYNGNLLATTSRDRKLRVWDIRSNEVISEGPGHTGAKNSRVTWLGNSDRIGTTGFSKLSDRQIAVWDSGNIGNGPIGGFHTLDSSAGILIPFFDDSTKIFYVGGKGDGNIRYFEFQDDEFYPLSEFQSSDPQRGLAIAPKRTVSVTDNEVLKLYKTSKDSIIEPVSFTVPRKSEVFQSDIYPDAPSNKPALTTDEWFNGKSVDGPILFSVESLYNGSEPTFTPSAAQPESKPAPKEEEEKKEKVEESKPEVKESEKEISKESIKESSSVPSTPTLESFTGRSTPKTNVDEVLQKDEKVDSLLQKAADLDDGKKQVEESNWDDEDDQFEATDATPVKLETPKPKVETKPETNKEPKEEPKPEIKKKVEEIKEEPKVVIKEEVKEEVKETAKDEQPKSESAPVVKEDSNSTDSSVSKPLTLKGSIDKLSSLAEYFEKVVERLEASNLEKDERLQALELKVQELINKK